MIAPELAILKLRPRFGETSATMRERHTLSGEISFSSIRRKRGGRSAAYPASFHAFTKARAARPTASALTPGL